MPGQVVYILKVINVVIPNRMSQIPRGHGTFLVFVTTLITGLNQVSRWTSSIQLGIIIIAGAAPGVHGWGDEGLHL